MVRTYCTLSTLMVPISYLHRYIGTYVAHTLLHSTLSCRYLLTNQPNFLLQSDFQRKIWYNKIVLGKAGFFLTCPNFIFNFGTIRLPFLKFSLSNQKLCISEMSNVPFYTQKFQGYFCISVSVILALLVLGRLLKKTDR